MTSKLSDQRARALHALKTALRRLNAEQGNPILMLDVTTWSEGRYQLTYLHWQPHGIAARTTRDLAIPAYLDTADKVMPLVRERTAAMMEHARQLSSIHGTPRIVTADEVDVSILEIDRPLAALLRRTYGENALARLRQILTASIGSPESRIDNCSTEEESVGIVDIKVKRCIVRGKFTIRRGSTQITWSRGAVIIKGVHLPETILNTLPNMNGETLDRILTHPLLDPAMTITDAGHVAKSDGPKLTIMLKGATAPVNEVLP